MEIYLSYIHERQAYLTRMAQCQSCGKEVKKEGHRYQQGLERI